jgi:hypothetical protein
MRSIIAVAISILIPVTLLSQKGNDDFAQSSLLASGKWHTIKTTNEGVYKITYADLMALGFSDLSRIRMFGNNQGQLSYYNDDPSYDDLREIAIDISKGTDGIFNEGDYLLFYSTSTHRWRYDKLMDRYLFSRHNYSDTSVYFITEMAGEAKSVTTATPIALTPSYSTNAYDVLYIKEEESVNIISSGREWYQPVSPMKAVEISPGFQSLIPDEPIRYKIRVVGRSGVPSMFRLTSSGETLLSLMVAEVNMFNTTGTYAKYAEAEGTLPYQPSPAYELNFFRNGEPLAEGWLDYFWLHGRAELAAGQNTLIFSDARSVGSGLVNEYTIKSASAGVTVWDVTDHEKPVIVPATFDGTYIRFLATADSLKRFALFRSANVPAAKISLMPLPNQNLHATEPSDMIIIAHPWFEKYAEQLADIHYHNSGLVSHIVTPSQIYNEYSGGIQDISAIRNYVRMVWKRHENSERPLRYLLLFGDGSYQNKIQPPDNPNFIPTWQTQNSNIVVSSFMSDDFYGLLGEGEGESTGFLDIGIGRLPVSDTLQASILVNKSDLYLNGSDPGVWRNMITFVADDEDGNLHMSDAENLASLVSSVNPALNADKIYLDAFRQVTSINGQTYPEVTKAINDRIEKGTLIFNYLGHGNELGLAHERVVKTSDINSWKNISRLPLFITATCEFSRYDDVEYNLITRDYVGKTSAGEMALLNPTGGAIALMTTTRVVFSAPNYILNRNIYQYAFGRDAEGNPPRLGDIIRLAKINSGSGNNKRNFSLLGDPALRLAYPWEAAVITDSINGRHFSTPADTIKALAEVTISGHIEGYDGSLLNNFTGVLNTTIYDKPVTITTLANDGGQKMEFNLLNSVLFSGKTMVTNGRFSVRFIVPRDIDYNYGKGKISYYTFDGEKHATGFNNEILIGGFSDRVRTDTTGPVIRLFLNDTLFRPGGISDSEPVLLATLSDSSGINTTGTGIGHDVTMWINAEINNSVVLNNWFEAGFNNYMEGTIRYPVGVLSPGQKSITLKAWDNYNNSSQETLYFVVGDNVSFVVTDVINYPNPFTHSTRITAGHNRPDDNLHIEINIYDQSGRKIRMIRTTSPSGGYQLAPVEWDRTAEDGSLVGGGTYIFRITVSTGNSEIATGSGRMIIL